MAKHAHAAHAHHHGHPDRSMLLHVRALLLHNFNSHFGLAKSLASSPFSVNLILVFLLYLSAHAADSMN